LVANFQLATDITIEVRIFMSSGMDRGTIFMSSGMDYWNGGMELLKWNTGMGKLHGFEEFMGEILC